MDYAVIKIQGQQFKVSEGDEILVGKLKSNKPVAEVLLVKKGKKVEVGTPVVKGAKVAMKVVEAEEKGEKIYVATYKAKSRSRRRIGFRPLYSRLKIGKIS